uniref:Uncharacterized protein n=1 Tax=Glossina pallidipes TaxID=7398 RepID=A0A1A9Z5E3_GLOPL
MIRVSKDFFVPKYVNGRFTWNAEKERIQFDSREKAVKEAENTQFIVTNGYKFASSMNQREESIFRKEFQRSENSYDADVVLIQDIKNVVTFLAPRDVITRDFLLFLNSDSVNLLLRAMILYFENFLKLAEFILIRRDDICGENAQTESEESIKLKRVFSEHLSQYRILIAREYSKIVLCSGDLKPFYHVVPVANVSMTKRDQNIHELFLAFCIQIVWIAMHRRCFNLIETEINRLFRSEHFQLRRSKTQFTKAEARLLYGKNYRRCNYRAQNSPLIQELTNVEKHNLPILWLGKRKYRGTDLRIMQLELEFIVPSCHLTLIDSSRGILGHPKILYNTLLRLDWEKVRTQNFTKGDDPYRLIRQPYLELPHLDEEKIRKLSKTYATDCELTGLSRNKWTQATFKKWADDFVPRYVNGHWIWNEENETFKFNSRNEATKNAAKEEFVVTGGYKFLASLNQLEELIFRQDYQRSPKSFDADVVTSHDVLNLVTFLAPDEMMNKTFLQLINTFAVRHLLKALILYFSYFLKVVEYILIRRDEKTSTLPSNENAQIQVVLSSHLTQYRLLVARAYSTIIKGEGDVGKFHHVQPLIKISRATSDRTMHEQLLAFCTQFIWITMHRRSYDIIDFEMNRLFRSEHFKLTRNEKIRFTGTEARLLYGKYYRRRNYRNQSSPLIQEIINVEKHNLPILWLGKRKYRGTDLRIKAIEIEFIVNTAQSGIISATHGILGHPRHLYNTLLEPDWEAIRFSNYSKDYDPHYIVTQPSLKIPDMNEEEIRKLSETYESDYTLATHTEFWSDEQINKWMRRSRTQGTVIDIWTRCSIEIADKSHSLSMIDMLQRYVITNLLHKKKPRPSTTYDSDSILIEDVKNVVAFLAPATVMTASLIDFINTETANAFLKTLIMYFEYYLKIVELILIRRDELATEDAQILSTEDTDVRRVYSAHLQQYRLLLAREYSRIILGDGDVKKFYHLRPIVNISKSATDKHFHESLLAFCTQAIWITMHRRAYDVIDMEMNRLFRSEHFKLTRYPRLEFNKPESQMLYGPNYKRTNYRTQCSPLVQELNNVSQHNLPILSIGKHKYYGTDLRIKQLEMEFLVDVAQLVLVGLSFGILGHPKELYSTHLKLDWEKVRKHNFSKSYDPYGIFTQPHLKTPNLNEEKLRLYAETYKPNFDVKCQIELWTPEMVRKWKIRDKFIRQFKAKGAFTDIWSKCSKELADTSYELDVEEIVKKFIADKTKHRKLRQKEISVKAKQLLSDNK